MWTSGGAGGEGVSKDQREARKEKGEIEKTMMKRDGIENSLATLSMMPGRGRVSNHGGKRSSFSSMI